MVEYWDPTYRCFTFGQVDMTPTIEEYQRLLGFPTTPYTPYLHDPQGDMMDKVEFLFPSFRVGNQFSRDRRGWSWNAWKEFLHNRVDPTYRLKFFGVALFGLVVFPRLPNVIDIAAVGAFYEVDNLDANPVVTILADTFLSLNSYAEEFQRVKLAWREPYYLERLQPSDKAVNGYKEWQLKRIKNCLVPHFGGQLPPALPQTQSPVPNYYVATGTAQDQIYEVLTGRRRALERREMEMKARGPNLNEYRADLYGRIRELEARLIESDNNNNLLAQEIERMQELENLELQSLDIENSDLRIEIDKLMRRQV
ncbi:hypothetical protein Tsubulata_034602 [Turnera subulata]|uniref:DUF7745 domain-containing protein n=1 Tax=Turnera subulata TaxID=218843 RepID=A0A9Q0JJX4_9ROSI|nr:hypothetical protein Tsubulata_034602 [Turnera subulata]